MQTTDYSPFEPQAQAELDASRKEKLQAELRAEVEDFGWLMSGPRGRRIVRRLLAKTGLYQSSNRDGEGMLAFHEGQRNVGLRLMALINEHFPDEYILMLQEIRSE